ncbi:MAG: hypothetical protein RIQ81_1873 [Pseudomonadota bacterium]
MFDDPNNDNASAPAAVAEPATDVAQAPATTSEPAPATGTAPPVESASGAAPNAPQHTESPPAAQGTPGVIKAQNDFLGKLETRIRTLEMLGLVALNLPDSQQAAAKAYGTLWNAQNRKSFRIVTRIKKRMRLMANT